jgi:hypothetical protein
MGSRRDTFRQVVRLHLNARKIGTYYASDH